MSDTPEVKKDQQVAPGRSRWRSFFGRNSAGNDVVSDEVKGDEEPPTKWSMGVLNDRITHEVPGKLTQLQE